MNRRLPSAPRPQRPGAATAALRRLGAALLCTSALFAAPWAQANDVPAGDEDSLRTLLRNEGQAYENGEGVERDPARAAVVYCEAARLGDAVAQFNLAWMYANGRGVERSDSTAAFFFHAAAEQGLPQAQRMLGTVGGPSSYIPDCMREREPPKLAVATKPVSANPGTAAKAAASAADLRLAELSANVPKTLLDIVKKAAPEYKVQPTLALSIMEAESNYDIVALSPRNAKGLMQLIPETMARFSVRNAYDPEQNIRGGLAYLRWLLAYYEGDVMLVAAAYNAGEGTVNRYRGVPPYAETRAYVAKILANVQALVHPFDPSVADPSPQLRQIREMQRRR